MKSDSLSKKSARDARIEEIRRSLAARRIQRTWQKFNCLRNEMRSIIEDIAIVDYTFRNEKLFDFTQIEIDESINNRQQDRLNNINLIKIDCDKSQEENGLQ